jgi:RNA recognition motif-containing protein
MFQNKLGMLKVVNFFVEIFNFFLLPVGEVAYVELFHDENDKPRGCGVVEFESADSVKKAVEKMHRYDLKGRKLVVKEVSKHALEQL